ncbi:MAG TPA: DUF4118 domain-containing protein [Opitutaceae bacterium]|nr:DUF4118 domain-containing protein [Opitutaceae bacterium]
MFSEPLSAAAAPTRRSRRRAGAFWNFSRAIRAQEYLEVCGVIALVTVAGWFVPLTYHTFGLIYLLVVIALSVRVGRWPALFAAVTSAVAWNFVFIPPRLSFSVLEMDDSLLLGTYLIVALVAGQLTTRIRAQERLERERERSATALFHLTRAIAEARTLDEAVEAALRQADLLFHAETALLRAEAPRGLVLHAASSFVPGETDRAAAEWAWRAGVPAGRFTGNLPNAAGLHVPMLRTDNALGIFVLRMPDAIAELPPIQRDLAAGFAAQIALLLEREELRAASEREKFFAESDRLHRTLLDSVSHELKTPLSVLRAAGERVDTGDAGKRGQIAGEIRVATSRLDHLVANLLNQSRLESGRMRPALDWCDARDIVQLARRAVGDALAGRPLRVEIPEDLPLFMADVPLMEQVLANLLLNAARHTPAGTSVVVSAGREARAGGEWIFLRIDDRGPGLPASWRENLFQKFRRGPEARAGGLGLGLSIVRGFVQAQGGDVTAGDNPAGGARFTVYLPYAAPGPVPTDER